MTDKNFKDILFLVYTTPDELIKMGFAEQEGDKLDNGYYRWWKLEKGESSLEVTAEYDDEDSVVTYYADFNGQTLKGRIPNKKDIITLIELM